MYIDYEFYKTIYGGTNLTETNFNKYAEKAESIISAYTLDRVNDNTINRFPDSLVDKIKKCACELAELSLNVAKANEMININPDGITGVIKSKTAGAVSITYDTTDNSITNTYLDSSNISKKKKYILNEYLYPQFINGKYYNLLSWVG